jgi:integrase
MSRARGEGTIDERGNDCWRLRYRVNGKRYTVAFRGTKTDARKKLRELLRAGDTGQHIEPNRITVGQWIEQWLSMGAPGQRQKALGGRALEKYSGLMRKYVVPVLGNRPLQKLEATEIDLLYSKLKVRPSNARYTHIVLASCLATAKRKGLITSNPMTKVSTKPSIPEQKHGKVLDNEGLARLIKAFMSFSLYPLVVVAAYTGMRLGELLALRWTDFDPKKKELRVERALERVNSKTTFKAPKNARGYRTVGIPDDLVAFLLTEKEKHQRAIAGIPDGADVDLSLIKLPERALIFPAFGPGEIDLTKPRNRVTVSGEFRCRVAKLGFKGFRFHDLRGSHATALIDNGTSIHVVAARLGHDPAVLMRSYAKVTDKAKAEVVASIASMGLLGK